jgi:hypothetical protein
MTRRRQSNCPKAWEISVEIEQKAESPCLPPVQMHEGDEVVTTVRKTS